MRARMSPVVPGGKPTTMRTGLFRHLQSLSLDFFERRRLGDVISRLTGDISSIESFVLSGVTDALSYALRILFFGAALFYLQWDLALADLQLRRQANVAEHLTSLGGEIREQALLHRGKRLTSPLLQRQDTKHLALVSDLDNPVSYLSA